jgi:hypothetical protein
MKTVVSGIAGLLLSSSVAFGAGHDAQTELDLQAMALVHLSQLHAEGSPEALRLGGLGDIFKDLEGLVQKIEEVQDEIVDQFDANENGRIDPGPELDNFKETMQSIIMLLADSNGNGRIDLQDIAVLTQTVLDQAKAKALEVACPTIIREAEKAGWWLRFRPVLKHFYEICTFGV